MQVDGYSLDAQRDKLRKYAAYEDMVVAGEYSDEGFSGKNIQGRQEFQRMLNDIQDCKDGVSYVLVFKLSRFGRNAADVLNSLQLMQDFGVNLICVEDGIDSSKDAGKLMISVLSAVAEIERAVSKLSDGQKKSIAYRAKQLIASGGIDSNKTIATLEKCLGVELVEHDK